MSKTVEEIKAELAALDGQTPAQPVAPLAAQRGGDRFTDEQMADLALMREQLAVELAPRANPEQLSETLSQPEPVPELTEPEERKPLLTQDDLWRYKAWKAERELMALPCSVADWIADTGATASL